MRKVVQLTLFIFLTNSPNVKASYVKDLCDEFAQKQVSQGIHLTINYLKDSENITRTLQTAAELEAWCRNNFSYIVNPVSILSMPNLNVISTGWELYGIPVSNILTNVAGLVIAGAGVYWGIKQFREESIKTEMDTRNQKILEDIQEKIEILDDIQQRVRFLEKKK
ncbi:MAG: hypothetical protein ACRYGR_03125 [Janthinobacterium lividum]